VGAVHVVSGRRRCGSFSSLFSARARNVLALRRKPLVSQEMRWMDYYPY